MFARFDENLAMTLHDIKEIKRYGRTDAQTHARTDNVKTVYPPQTKFAGGIISYKVHDQPKTDVCLQFRSIISRHCFHRNKYITRDSVQLICYCGHFG